MAGEPIAANSYLAAELRKPMILLNQHSQNGSLLEPHESEHATTASTPNVPTLAEVRPVGDKVAKL